MAYVPIRALACAIASVLVPMAWGHVIQAADATVPEEFNVRTNAETAWMVTGIIFIVLFAVAVIVCVYLWYLRNAKVKELRHLQAVRNGKDTQNVWYGGGHGNGNGAHM